MMTNRLISKIVESLTPEVREFLRANRYLIPVMIALGPKLAKKVRPEHLKYLMEHKDLIPVLIEAGGVSAWGMLVGLKELQKPYLGPLWE